MNPDQALQEQIERYRRMTGEERLKIALDLHELGCNMARASIRHQNPGADEADVERLLRLRLELAREGGGRVGGTPTVAGETPALPTTHAGAQESGGESDS